MKFVQADRVPKHKVITDDGEVSYVEEDVYKALRMYVGSCDSTDPDFVDAQIDCVLIQYVDGTTKWFDTSISVASAAKYILDYRKNEAKNK